MKFRYFQNCDPGKIQQKSYLSENKKTHLLGVYCLNDTFHFHLENRDNCKRLEMK